MVEQNRVRYAWRMHRRSSRGARFSAVVMHRHQREGFYPLRSYEPGYPKVNGWTPDEATAFLEDLDLVEARVHHSGKLYHRDRHFCRLCGRPVNGRELVHGGWAWPECLRHYVESHLVKPADAFIEFVRAEAANLREHWREAPLVDATTQETREPA